MWFSLWSFGVSSCGTVSYPPDCVLLQEVQTRLTAIETTHKSEREVPDLVVSIECDQGMGKVSV